MAIFTGTLATDPPSDLAKLANDGRVNLVSSTSIRWDGSVVGLWNGSNWAVCKPATLPSAINTSTDMNGTALQPDKIYDVFLNYSSVTSCPFAFSRWAVSTAGSSARNAAYAAGTAYAIGDRVTYSGRDYTNIQAGTGQTPSSSPTYWVDNGTSVSGDFAGLYRHDGVLVSHNSDAGKKLRWLGVIYTYNNSSVVNFKDDDQYRYISNYYNPKGLSVTAYQNSSSWTYTTATWREANGGTNMIRGNFISCVSQDIQVNLLCNCSISSASYFVGLGAAIDSTTSNTIAIDHFLTTYTVMGAAKTANVLYGNHYLTVTDYASGGTANYYGQGNNAKATLLLRG